jgi:hypothetical protein
MSLYRVEKSELSVVVFQADGSVMKGVVFLSATAYSHMGQQTLLDLLKEPGDFFPFRSEAGDFCVTNKQTITHIRFEPPEQEEDYQSLGDREDVDIKFVGGEQLCGTVTIDFLISSMPWRGFSYYKTRRRTTWSTFLRFVISARNGDAHRDKREKACKDILAGFLFSWLKKATDQRSR